MIEVYTQLTGKDKCINETYLKIHLEARTAQEECNNENSKRRNRDVKVIHENVMIPQIMMEQIQLSCMMIFLK